MKHVRLIRHGESAANVGAASSDHATIPLTENGIEQAHLVAKSFIKAPDLIVASPFSRARATAMATARAFSFVPLEIWPIHEFTYLEPARCANTTVAQRREWVEAYWFKSDPTLTDGEGAESFLDFISRAQAFLDRLADHPAQDIAVFSHGQYINAVAWLIERKPMEIDGHAMANWREYEIANHVPNCSGYTLSKNGDDDVWKVCLGESEMYGAERAQGRNYQDTRNPERVLFEERAKALSEAGYPLPEDDSARYAEQRLKEAGGAARASHPSQVSEAIPTKLSPREVCQLLREVTYGRRSMTKVSTAPRAHVCAERFEVDVEGWRVSIYRDGEALDYCENCTAPDGRQWSFDSGNRFGTDPIALLSTWEHHILTGLLKDL